MPVLPQLSSSPYFDDFSQDTKDFLRVLFRPGYNVQARELNQAQSILQNQVSRFGDHIFQDGSLVVGGSTSVDCSSAMYVKLQDNYPTSGSSPVVVANYVGQVITGATSGASGVVVSYSIKNLSTPNAFVYRPLNGLSFSASEDINVNSLPIATTASSTPCGASSTVSISDGIFYVKGFFAKVSAQTIPLDPFSNTPLKKAGLAVSTVIVTPDMDSTLLDNANGSYNYAAPGAHRLELSLTLTSQDPSYTANAGTFIQLLDIRNGVVFQTVTNPNYSELMKLLADRLKDQSGDFVVEPFLVNMTNHPSDPTKVVANISAGKSYVDGYKVQTVAPVAINVPKARTTATAPNLYSPVSYGNYCTVTLSKGLPPISSFGNLWLFSSSNAAIGTARCRNIDFVSGSSYRLYIFDVAITASASTFTSVTSIGTSATYAACNDLFVVAVPGPLQGVGLNSLVYDTGFDVVASLTAGTMSLSYRTNYSATLSGGSCSIQTASGNERFQGSASSTLSSVVASANYYVACNDSTNGNYQELTNFAIALGAAVPGNTQSATLSFIVPFLAASVNTSTDVITANGHGFSTGQPVVYNSNSGTTVAGLTNGTTYYAISVTSNSFALADTYAHAISNTKIDLTGTGNDAQTVCLNSPVKIIASVNIVNASPNTKTEVKLQSFGGYAASTVTASTSVPLPMTASSVDAFYTGGSVRIVAGTGSGSTTYTVASYTGSTRTLVLSAPVTLDTTSRIVISPGFTSAASGTGYVYAATNPTSISLGVADATRIVKVLSNTGAPVTSDWFASSSDVTSSYTLDNGQRDGYYDIASANLLPGKTVPGPVVVFFEYYSHGSGDGFFCANSYADQSQPKLYSDSQGILHNLVNSIDFRPTKTSLSAFASGKLAEANSNFIATTNFYLPRVDKIAVDKSGNFQIVSGVPGINPAPPQDLSGTMALYDLAIPAYTYDASNVGLTFRENKRYTMQDIGKLDSRISAIEYASSLSALEQQTANFPVVDANGNVRTKTGILVDNFDGHDVGDPNNSDYRCAIDPGKQQLRPPFVQRAYGLDFLSSDPDTTNAVQRGDLITAAFTDSVLISQPFATVPVNVNPNSISDWIGQLSLSPRGDYWKDIRFNPSNVVNPDGTYDNFHSGNAYGSLFDQWNSMWYGVSTTTASDVVTYGQGVYKATFQPITINYGAGNTVSITDPSLIVDIADIPTYLPPSFIAQVASHPVTYVKSITPGSTSTVNTPVPPSVGLTELKIGDYVVNLAMNEFIRARNITFSATGLKPLTVVRPYFDGKLVSGFVTPGTLTTDASGSVSGTFQITIGRFFTGKKLFILTDGSDATRSNETTGCQQYYTVLGLQAPDTLLSLPVPELGQETIYPLAQIFTVDPIQYPEGIFASKADFYFAEKDPTLPLTIQLRSTSNGYPSDSSVLSSVSVPASSINVSTDGSVATTVTFPNVVHLVPGDYAIVMRANSSYFEPWAAQIGGSQANGNLVFPSPYTGVLFTTSGTSSWVANRNLAMKFNLYNASFTTGTFSTAWTDWNSSNSANINVVATSQSAASGATVLQFADIITSGIVWGAGVSGTNIQSGTTVIAGDPVSGSVTLSLPTSGTVASGASITFTQKPSGSAVADLVSIPDAVYSPFASATVQQSIRTTPYGGSLESTWTPVQPNHNFNFQTRKYFSVSSETMKKKITCTVGSQYVSPIIPAYKQAVVAVANQVNNVTGFVTSLTAGINSSVTAIPVADAGEINNGDTLQIGNEKILVVSGGFTSGPASLTVLRGYAGSTAASASSGASVNDNTLDETQPLGGGCAAKYITRRVSLPTNNSYLRVWLSANIPSSGSLAVFYKVKSSEDSDPLSNKNWVRMNQVSPNGTGYSTDPSAFPEYSFVPFASSTDGNTVPSIVYTSSNGGTYNNFSEFLIKIDILSTSTVSVPLCTGLKIAATA